MSTDTFLFGLVGLLIGAVVIHVVAVIRDHRQPAPASRIDAPLVAVSRPLMLMVAVHSTIGAWFAMCTIPVVLFVATLFAVVRGPVLMVAAPSAALVNLFLCGPY